MTNNNHPESNDQQVAQSRILSYLQQRQSGVLVTVGANNLPHAAVIYYATDEIFITRFLTRQKTQKSEDFKSNTSAVLVVYDEESQTTVRVEGLIEQIEDEAETHKAFRNSLKASLRTSGVGVPPVAKLSAGDYIAFRLVPNHIIMASYGSGQVERHELKF